jgi:hypothetical protein
LDYDLHFNADLDPDFYVDLNPHVHGDSDLHADPTRVANFSGVKQSWGYGSDSRNGGDSDVADGGGQQLA